MRCEICQDSQIIRLARYRRASADFRVAPGPTQIEQNYSEYPCPECAPLIPKEKVRVVECHARADNRYEHDANYRKHVVTNAVLSIADEIDKEGFARVEVMPKANNHVFMSEYRVSIGVVSPRVIETIDAERHAAEDAFADLVFQIAANKIDNWGSYYGVSTITKADAKRLAAEAIKSARDTRPKSLAPAVGEPTA